MLNQFAIITFSIIEEKMRNQIYLYMYVYNLSIQNLAALYLPAQILILVFLASYYFLRIQSRLCHTLP